MKTNYQIGVEAFINGCKRSFALDVNMSDKLFGREVGDPVNIETMNEWYRGWDAAHEAAMRGQFPDIYALLPIDVNEKYLKENFKDLYKLAYEKWRN
ncbi:hypothetical protein Kuja_0300 [Vibrio phage vB_VchM_Kuja]|uniref:Uncharacterized protein n=1 Tax=Vibrio phage vB_VchM_Kuja TaxID=2686437 RepID=A0A6B9J599_9CAUD|nr:hypothetical protein HWC83_gp030 [Vibrio phage vB_VchM_Kuja]QGZ16021.1 hypothetical protein Kuja_0300 [Vibrio phage vB_VchM_Kuja]